MNLAFGKDKRACLNQTFVLSRCALPPILPVSQALFLTGANPDPPPTPQHSHRQMGGGAGA